MRIPAESKTAYQELISPYRFQRVVVLLSGGLDSTTALMEALSFSKQVAVLSFDYGQRHRTEVKRARLIYEDVVADLPNISSILRLMGHYVQKIDLRLWGQSALTQKDIEVPKDRLASEMGEGIPVTYVPARNTVFLAFALSLAEAIGAEAVVGGWNVLDYSGYPDCRMDFLEAMEKVFLLGTRQGREGNPISIEAPLIRFNKTQIIQRAVELHAPLHLTWSCYDPQVQANFTVKPCGRCDSCLLRAKGFQEAGIEDPAL